MRRFLFVYLWAVLMALSPSWGASIMLPAIFSEHMVLQKTSAVPIWGRTTPGERVSVAIGGLEASSVADADGNWRVLLDLSELGTGPFEMRINGNEKVISDVVIGEVWLASGQSNMAWALGNTIDAKCEIEDSQHTMLRQFVLEQKTSSKPTRGLAGRWVISSPTSAGSFSALAYYFGKSLQKEIRRPVGIVLSTWPGTPAEAWTSLEGIQSLPEIYESSKRHMEYQKVYSKNRDMFVEGFLEWVTKTNRNDRLCPDLELFAVATPSLEGWKEVRIPSVLKNCEYRSMLGAIWLRRDFQVENTELPVHLEFSVNGFDSVYWNGRLVKKHDLDDLSLSESYRFYEIPPSFLRLGKNTLAVRIFSPAVPAEMGSDLRVDSLKPDGATIAKVEFEFPSVSADFPPPVAPSAAMPREYTASFLFNGMIFPIKDYAIKGVIWYQGESNVQRAFQYRTLFPLLISDWRRAFENESLPFYFCQLPNFGAKEKCPGESQWAELREAQSLALQMPRTGQVVTIDVGESDNVHPQNKRVVGERFARLVLAREYGLDFGNYSAPVYRSMRVEGAAIRLFFDDVRDGLKVAELSTEFKVNSMTGATAVLQKNAPESELQGFAICGSDHNWKWANAKIDGDTVLVWAEGVEAPEAVRYAWSDNPTCNLVSRDGFPVSPFRTDSYKGMTFDARY